MLVFVTVSYYNNIMSDSIFSKIIRKEIPAHFVYEDEKCVVIMDKFPATQGQTLVIPKEEMDYAFDLNDDMYLHLFSVAKKIAKASDKALGVSRTCLAIEGFEVPHTHIKLYPIPEGIRDLGRFLTPGVMANDEDLAKLATDIKAAL